jgi:Fungal Zn(2)-Cys(6) binuclear cluster domain
MAAPSEQSSVPTPRKRKLKHPRTSHACAFCRKRKTRCSGEVPACTACRDEEIECDYSTGYQSAPKKRSVPLTPSGIDSHDDGPGTPSPLPTTSRSLPTPQPLPQSLEQPPSAVHSRRTSIDPPETTFDNGLHVGPTSGVSFLYKWPETRVEGPPEGGETVPLASYGDVPMQQASKCPFPDAEEGRNLM